MQGDTCDKKPRVVNVNVWYSLGRNTFEQLVCLYAYDHVLNMPVCIRLRELVASFKITFTRLYAFGFHRKKNVFLKKQGTAWDLSRGF